MNTREALVWGGILTGIFAMLWMSHVLMATDRPRELVGIALLGGAGLSLLSRQARRMNAPLGMYIGFAAAALCFGLAFLIGFTLLSF